MSVSSLAPLVLRYEDKRGAGVVRFIHGGREEVIAVLSKIRRPAELSRDDKIVGGVDEVDGADDRRIRWNWWVDAEEVTGG